MIGEPDATLEGSCTLPPGVSGDGSKRAVKFYAYDGFGELTTVTECADGDTFHVVRI